MKKICVFGVGAIGGLLAARLARAGYDVSGIARGAQLDAIRQNGLTLVADGNAVVSHIHCVANPAEVGEQDLVIFAVKSHALPPLADASLPLLGSDTVVLSAVNGVPWWFDHGLAGAAHRPLMHVDPQDRLWQTIGPERALGCIVYPAARVSAPGIVEHVSGNRFSVGEPDQSLSGERAAVVAGLFNEAGFDTEVSEDIRNELWIKIVANAAYNPVNLLTGGELGLLLGDQRVNELLQQIMNEVVTVARAYGAGLPFAVARLIELTRPFAAHRTSMRQDLDAGRSVELGPVVFAVAELGERAGIETPLLDRVAALAAQRARLAGCYA